MASPSVAADADTHSTGSGCLHTRRCTDGRAGCPELSSSRRLQLLRDGPLASAQQRLRQLPHDFADGAGGELLLRDGDLVAGAADDLIENVAAGALHLLDGVVEG